MDNNKIAKGQNRILFIIVNAVIALSTAVIAGVGVFSGAGDGQVGEHIISWGYFKPFTMDSNILAGAAALVNLVYGIRKLAAGREIPRWAVTLQLMGSASLMLTFIVAALFLAPIRVMNGGNYFGMFQDDMFFFHFLNPVLSFLSFAFLQEKYSYEKRESIFGAIPAIIYSGVYLVAVVFMKIWSDFYGFTFGGRMYMVPVVIIVIYAVVFLFSLLLISLHNRR